MRSNTRIVSGYFASIVVVAASIIVVTIPIVLVVLVATPFVVVIAVLIVAIEDRHCICELYPKANLRHLCLVDVNCTVRAIDLGSSKFKRVLISDFDLQYESGIKNSLKCKCVSLSQLL